MALTRTGWPRPVVGGLPIPWVSPSDDLATMNGARAIACSSGAVCAVCGEGYEEDETAYAFVKEKSLPDDLGVGAIRAMDNGILHQRCARLALAVCPKLKSLVREGMLQIVKTAGNIATPMSVEDGELAAMIDGKDCEAVDNVSEAK